MLQKRSCVLGLGVYGLGLGVVALLTSLVLRLGLGLVIHCTVCAAQSADCADHWQGVKCGLRTGPADRQ